MSDKYNATVTEVTTFVEGLAIYRVEPDHVPVSFEAGQYTTLGLLPEAPRVAGSDPDPPGIKPGKMIKRAYSIGSSCKVTDHFDFYLVLVSEGALTPRLFALGVGDRLWVAKKCVGTFTLEPVREDQDVVLIGTGTGVAPYMSMIRAYFDPAAPRKWAIVHGTRKSFDLSYHDELTALASKHDNFFYYPAITRPDDDPWKGPVGRLNKLLEEGTFETAWGHEFDAASQHVYLCGNPGMIDGAEKWLQDKGFSEYQKKKNPDGNIHFEKYW
ncbi:MAG: ferredoxin--NADP reductase [Gemmatimonadetes bacterium]|nr:ferredoxin--NADP reductase [Gemmatimonadota bacterium]